MERTISTVKTCLEKSDGASQGLVKTRAKPRERVLFAPGA